MIQRDTTCRQIVRLLFEAGRPVHRKQIFKRLGGTDCNCNSPHFSYHDVDLESIPLNNKICSGMRALKEIGCIRQGWVRASVKYTPTRLWAGVKTVTNDEWRFFLHPIYGEVPK